MVGDILGCDNCGGYYWSLVGRGEAAKHPAMHSTAAPTKNYLAQNVKVWLLKNPGLD